MFSITSKQPGGQLLPLVALGAALHACKGSAAHAGARLALGSTTAAYVPVLNSMSGACPSGQCSIKSCCPGPPRQVLAAVDSGQLYGEPKYEMFSL